MHSKMAENMVFYWDNRFKPRMHIPLHLAASFLLLPPAESACPTNWGTARQPSWREWGSRCLFVPPERSTSLFRCVDLCAEHGGTPACIGSAAENDVATAKFAAAADGLWLGLYQNEMGLGPTCCGSTNPYSPRRFTRRSL